MKSATRAIKVALCATLLASAGTAGAWGHPIILSLDVKNCTTNKNQVSSVRITTQSFPGLGSKLFTFRNIASGQVHTFNYPMNFSAPHEFTLPGGNYTLKIAFSSDGVAAMPRTGQLLYEMPMQVPTLSGGVCSMTGLPR